MKRLLLNLLTLLPLSLFAQLTGIITNQKGETIPFANVYIENTTRGTTANTEGVYFFDLENGNHAIVFQSLAYQKKIEQVAVKGKTVLNIVLQNADIELMEVIVKSNAEDPAYPIIRKVIEQRPFFLKQVPTYTCDVYIKGLQKALDAPKKIMGRDLGTMGGSLDTSDGKRQGILYLSETISKLSVDGTKKKEELLTSKVSGNDNGLSFNRATLFNFDMYENTNNDLPRKFLSPIAENALNYYRYKLRSSTRNEESGLTIYKIEVLPVRNSDPTWSGFLYIVDNQWNLYATDLFVTGKNIQIEILDTLHLHQSYVQVKPQTWRVFSQTVDFKFGILGLKIAGFFSGVFSNYNLSPEFPKNFFRRELFSAAAAKKEKDSRQWDSLRPIPLTREESLDYVKKDSIQIVRQSKTYIDSVNRKNNKFTPLSILAGYTYSNYYRKWSLGFASLFETASFNAVQGLNGNIKVDYEKRFADSLRAPYKQQLRLSPQVNYGFAEQKFRPELKGSYLFNRFDRATLEWGFGQRVQQFNERSPITPLWAATSALFRKKHFYHIFEKTYGRIGFSKEVANGLDLKLAIEYAERAPISISTQYSFKKKDVAYNGNIPYDNLILVNPNFANAFFLEANLKWTIAQKYSTYPHYKDRAEAAYPVVSFIYQKAIPLSMGDANFDRVRLRIEQNRLDMGLFGYSEMGVEYGGFLRKERLDFMDYNHFNGNEIHISNPLNYMNGFFQLPFYQYSTPDNYVMLHYQHHFEGWLLGKLPLIRQLGFKEIVRVAYFHTPQLGNYAEFGFGIDNVGYGLFRLLRVDFNWQYLQGKLSRKPYMMLGIAAGIGN